jgi:hypothetical protein
VITELMEDWDTTIPLGLSAYGHNSKNNCRDIQTLLSPAPQASGVIANRVNPKGKIPLTAAVMQAAQAREYEDTPASVVLLSDAEETCGLDPGTMGAISDAVRAKARGVVIDGATPSGIVNLSAFATRDTPIVDKEVYWDIRQIGDDGMSDGKSSFQSIGPDISAELPPGRFRVHARYGGAFKYLDIQSNTDESMNVPVIFAAGRLRIRTEAAGAPPAEEVFWSAYPLEGNLEEGKRRDSVISQGSAEFALNEGLYRIKGSLQGHRPVSFDVLLQAGGVSHRTVNFEVE